MIDLRNTIIKTQISQNEKLNEIVDIVEKILNFNKQHKGKGIKILSPKQMLQSLTIAFSQVKPGNTYENTSNKRNTSNHVFFVLRKKITTNVYNNTMNSIKLKNRMETRFMNSGNSKTSDHHRLLLNLSDRINLNRSDIYAALLNLTIYYTWKNIKKSYKNKKFKISAPTWNE